MITCTVRVDWLPPADGVTVDGFRMQFVPIGAPLHDKETASANPFCPVTVIATVPD